MINNKKTREEIYNYIYGFLSEKIDGYKKNEPFKVEKISNDIENGRVTCDVSMSFPYSLFLLNEMGDKE